MCQYPPSNHLVFLRATRKNVIFHFEWFLQFEEAKKVKMWYYIFTWSTWCQRKNVILHVYVVLNLRRYRKYVAFYGPNAMLAKLTKQNPNRIDQAPSPIESKSSSQTANAEHVNKGGEVSWSYFFPLCWGCTCNKFPPFWKIICVCFFWGEVLNM